MSVCTLVPEMVEDDGFHFRSTHRGAGGHYCGHAPLQNGHCWPAGQGVLRTSLLLALDVGTATMSFTRGLDRRRQ